jgi:hypothetical protein
VLEGEAHQLEGDVKASIHRTSFRDINIENMFVTCNVIIIRALFASHQNYVFAPVAMLYFVFS